MLGPVSAAPLSWGRASRSIPFTKATEDEGGVVCARKISDSARLIGVEAAKDRSVRRRGAEGGLESRDGEGRPCSEIDGSSSIIIGRISA